MKGIIDLLKRINNRYDSAEMNLYHEIVDCFYSAHLGDRNTFLRFVPGEVNVEEGEKPINVIKYSLEFENWQKKIGLGILWHFIEEISSSICAFQILRYEKLLSKLGHMVYRDTLNDPLSLALEEMKHWMIMELSKTDFSIISECEGAKIQINNRVNYITKLSQIKSISTLEDTYELLQADITIFQVFVEIKHAFNMHVIPTIDLQISRHTSREQFKSLVGSTERIMKQGLRFLFYIFRDTPNMMSHFTIQEMRHPKISSNKIALNTGSGAILQGLLKTHFFMDTFPDTYPPMAIGSGAIQSIDIKGVLNKDILLQLCNKPENWWQQSDRGILINFAEEKTVNTFILAHLLLMVQATYYQLFQVGYDLSGDGGDIIVYGAVSQELRSLIDNHKYFLHNLLTNFHTLQSQAETVYMQRVYTKKREDEAWSQNYKYALSSYEDFSKSIGDSYSALIKLQSGLDTLTLKERLEKAKAKIQSFKLLNKNIVDYQETLLPRVGTQSLTISTEHKQVINALTIEQTEDFVRNISSQLVIKKDS